MVFFIKLILRIIPWFLMHLLLSLLRIKYYKIIKRSSLAQDVLHVSPPSLQEIRLGGFGLLDMTRIGYFGLVFDLEYPTCNNSCTDVFPLESLSPYRVAHSMYIKYHPPYIRTALMKWISHFAVDILLLHHYKSDLSHLSDFDILVIGLSKFEI